MTLYQYAYHSTVVRCPKCRRRVERVNLQASNMGCPISRCPYCQETVYNRYVTEPALAIYEDRGGEPDLWSVLCTILFNGLFLVCLRDAVWAERISTAAWLMMIFTLAVALPFDIGWVRMIIIRKNYEEYHQKQIDYLEGRGREQTEQVRESLRRLSRKKYLDELAEHGVDVPEYFYHRIGVKEKK